MTQTYQTFETKKIKHHFSGLHYSVDLIKTAGQIFLLFLHDSLMGVCVTCDFFKMFFLPVKWITTWKHREKQFEK